MDNTINLEQLFIDLGLEGLSAEEKQAYTQQILQLLEDRISTRMAELLTDEDLNQMEAMSEADIAEYLDSKGVNIAEISTAEGLALRESLLQDMAFAKGLISRSTEDSEA